MCVYVCVCIYTSVLVCTWERWIFSSADIRAQSMEKHRFSVTATYRSRTLSRYKIYLQTVNLYYMHTHTHT